jgi:hypothetical protein
VIVKHIDDDSTEPPVGRFDLLDAPAHDRMSVRESIDAVMPGELALELGAEMQQRFFSNEIRQQTRQAAVRLGRGKEKMSEPVHQALGSVWLLPRPNHRGQSDLTF